MIRLKNLFFIFAVAFLFVSCLKRHEFPCLVINESGYDITLGEFSGIISAPFFELDAGDSTEVFNASYQQRFRLNGKFLKIRIVEIDDPTGDLVLVSQHWLPFHKSDTRESPNVIRITSTQQGDSVFFDYSLN
jgi:hypothetical protein